MDGHILAKSHLSGMPELKIGFDSYAAISAASIIR